jgi:hypothetical protein
MSLNIHLQYQVNIRVTKICKSDVTPLQLHIYVCVIVGDLRTWNLKHANIK